MVVDAAVAVGAGADVALGVVSGVLDGVGATLVLARSTAATIQNVAAATANHTLCACLTGAG